MTVTLKHNIEHDEVVNGIRYRLAKSQSDIDKSVEFFFLYFLEEEPAQKSKGGYKGERHPGIAAWITDILLYGVSLMAEDASTGELVGIRTSYTIDRSELPMARPKEEDLLREYPELWAVLIDVFVNCIWAPDIMEQRPQVARVYEMFAMGVRPDQRGRGIATTLVKQSWAVARKAGCDLAMVAATNAFTKKIFDKLGMEHVSSYTWTDKKVGGKSYFDDVKSTKEMTGHVIHLN